MTDLVTRDPYALMERVLEAGDLAQLTPAERNAYYASVCQSVGLNPLTRPFEYVRLQGKLVLYVRKDGTDQLRKLHNISLRILSETPSNDLYSVKAEAKLPDGRIDADVGVVAIGGARGEALANAMMKAVTKAKRRVTLSICGLGLLDESEVADVPAEHREAWDEQTGEVKPPPAPPQEPARTLAEDFWTRPSLRITVPRGGGWQAYQGRLLRAVKAVPSAALLTKLQADCLEDLHAMSEEAAEGYRVLQSAIAARMAELAEPFEGGESDAA